MNFNFKVSGVNADEVVQRAEAQVARFAGNRRWQIMEMTVDTALVRGDGEVLYRTASVEAWIEGPA